MFSQSGISKNIGGFFESATIPLQKFTFDIFNLSNKSEEDKLREENLKLITQLAKQKEVEKENKALHDQFATTKPSPKELLPVRIIGQHGDEIILDKGERDAVRVGQVVVFKDNLIGQIFDTSMHRAVAILLPGDKISFTAKTVKTDASGVINGKGENVIILDKVVLSEKLEKEDIVVTKGDVDSSGNGYPSGLIVGKIVSVSKKASSLFQQAEIASLIDFSKLETVFILTQ